MIGVIWTRTNSKNPHKMGSFYHLSFTRLLLEGGKTKIWDFRLLNRILKVNSLIAPCVDMDDFMFQYSFGMEF